MWGPIRCLRHHGFRAGSRKLECAMGMPKYRGKIRWDDLSTVYMAAQVSATTNPSVAALHLSDEQLDAVKRKLLEIETEYSQDVVDRRGVDESLSESRDRGGHGMAADDQSTAQDQFSCRRDDSERKHPGWNRPSDDHGGQREQELAEEF